MKKNAIKKLTPPAAWLEVHELKVECDTLAICEPSIIITLESFNKHMLTF